MPVLPSAMAPAASRAGAARRRARSAASGLGAVALAAVAAVLLLAPTEGPSAFVACGAAAGALSAASFDLAAGRPHQVQRRAAAVSKPKRKSAKVKTGGKYRGRVSPKLRALIQSDEYRQIINMLARLEEQGALGEFLDQSEAYWKDVNIFELAMEESRGGGRKVVQTVKKDWPRIWPSSMEADRMPAFDKMAAFWRRLDQSRVVDEIMKEVLPNMGKKYNDMIADREQQRMMALSDEERRDEIMGRLGKSELVVQFAELCKGDAEVARIAPQMAPFMAKFVSILEVKVATQTESLGKAVDYGVFGVLAVALVGILLGTGVVKLPSDEAPLPPAYDASQATPAAAPAAVAVPNEAAP